MHCALNFLHAIEVASRDGQILVPENSLNLLQLAAGFMAEFRAPAAQVVAAK
jgi:hypothetical protein